MAGRIDIAFPGVGRIAPQVATGKARIRNGHSIASMPTINRIRA